MEYEIDPLRQLSMVADLHAASERMFADSRGLYSNKSSLPMLGNELQLVDVHANRRYSMPEIRSIPSTQNVRIAPQPDLISKEEPRLHRRSSVSGVSSESESMLRDRDHRQKGAVDNEGRRLIHNVSERRRRNSIKEGFIELKEKVPSLTREKHSKIDVLRQAVDYIDLLNSRRRSLTLDIERLRAEIRELKTNRKAGASGSNSSPEHHSAPSLSPATSYADIPLRQHSRGRVSSLSSAGIHVTKPDLAMIMEDEDDDDDESSSTASGSSSPSISS